MSTGLFRKFSEWTMSFLIGLTLLWLRCPPFNWKTSIYIRPLVLIQRLFAMRILDPLFSCHGCDGWIGLCLVAVLPVLNVDLVFVVIFFMPLKQLVEILSIFSGLGNRCSCPPVVVNSMRLSLYRHMFGHPASICVCWSLSLSLSLLVPCPRLTVALRSDQASSTRWNRKPNNTQN